MVTQDTKLVSEFSGHTAKITCLELVKCPDDKIHIWSSSFDTSIVIWDANVRFGLIWTFILWCSLFSLLMQHFVVKEGFAKVDST